MCQSLAQWLDGLGVGQYLQIFLDNDVDLTSVRLLHEADLHEMNISLGHRKLLLRAIAALAGDEPPAPAPPPTPPQADTPDAGAERRQLTVMFCDLVGSSALSRRLDPEDLQRVLLGWHECVRSAVAPYEGTVARFLGDGVLVYFGFPRAHEDDATRAVRGALAVLAALRAQRPTGLDAVGALEARIGIATGQVVTREIGIGTSAAEHTASGETPNLAARLQSQAQAGEIVVAEETRSLLREAFEFEPLSRLELKGFEAPMQAYRIAGERQLATRFEALRTGAAAASGMLGRDGELHLLLERFALAREGEGQIVLLSGEAGIGKSRLCAALFERVEGQALRVALQCSPYHTSSPLHPLIQHWERAAGLPSAEPPVVRTGRIERLAQGLPEAAVGCLLRLLGLPDGGRPREGGSSPQEERTHTLEALVQWLENLATERPVCVLVEDVHWIDPTTEDWIARVALAIGERPALLLLTCRPQYAPRWSSAAAMTRLALSRLPRRPCLAMVEAVAGKPLPAPVLAEIVRKTDGVPLFIEELTKTVMHSGLLTESAEGWHLRGQLPAIAIPATLQDSLMARLDRLAPAKQVAQVAAVVGREFTFRLIAAVLAPQMARERIEEALRELVEAELVFCSGTPPDAIYSFKHALVGDTAYASLLKSQRVVWHRQVAAALQTSGASSPEVLAHHLQEGGAPFEALLQWQAAGDAAFQRSAEREAVAHYEAAAALLPVARERQACDEIEMSLRIKLATASCRADGFNAERPRVNWKRARDLAATLDRLNELQQAVGGYSACLSASGRLREALDLLLRPVPDASHRTMGKAACLIRAGFMRMLLGDLRGAEETLSMSKAELESLANEEMRPVAGSDPVVALLNFTSQVQRCRGRWSKAHGNILEAVRLAELRKEPYGRVWVISELSEHLHERGDNEGLIAICRQAFGLAKRYGVATFGAQVEMRLGIGLVATGDMEAGLPLLREGCESWERYGGRFWSSLYLGAAAESLFAAERPQEALEFLCRAEATMRETGEVFQAARFLRLRGQVALREGRLEDAEASFREALAVSERQGAGNEALRGGTQLAALLADEGRRNEARELLRPLVLANEDGPEWRYRAEADDVLATI